MSALPTIAQLIKHYGGRLPDSICHCCGRTSVYQVGDFRACLLCDTNQESRMDAGVTAFE